MASSDDFKQQLKAGHFAKALAIAFSEAVELKITTWVSSDSDDLSSTIAKPGHRLHTRINIVDGDIENEIGEQFIANNPYKELRQFHFEQVAEGNEIIQSNLKSLQKLFEVLVTKNYQGSTTPVIEPQVSGTESQFLPPVESISTARLIQQPTESVPEESVMAAETVIEELPDTRLGIEVTESAPEESVMAADTVIEELTDTRLGIEVTDSVVEEPVITAESLIEAEQNYSAAAEGFTPTAEQFVEEQISEQQPIYSELNSFRELPIAIPETSDSAMAQEDEEDEEDWADSVLDFMESLPAASPSDVDPEWRDLTTEDSESDLASADSELSQNWGSPTLEELNSPSASPTPEIQISELELDGDWDDWVVEESSTLTDESVSEEPLLELQEEYDDWDDWVVEEPSTLTDLPVDDGLSSDLDTEESWNLEEYSEPFAAGSTVNGSISELEINEDWDEFVVEEQNIAPEIQDLDSTFDSSTLRKNLTSKDLDFYPINNSDSRNPLEGDVADEYSGLLEELEELEELEDELDLSPKPVNKRKPPNPPPKQN
ncbi:MAG: hypothetical protein F6J92_14665, partial [Symploca sp. SIO1A3]|nr:hypothetical protein [Symploca sp. SIO1A3]